MQPPACIEYDPRAVEAARRVSRQITSALPSVVVEHIGSTAVPGCAGKGIVDLMLLYPDGQLEDARQALETLGFQKQSAGHMHPESRPMRVGAVQCQGQSFRVHVHVIAAGSPEVAVIRAFRERLRSDPDLVAAYVRCKREILADDVSDARGYTERKSAFVQEVLTTSLELAD